MSALWLEITPGPPAHVVVRAPAAAAAPRLRLTTAGGAPWEVGLTATAGGDAWEARLPAGLPLGLAALRAEAPGLGPVDAVLRVDDLPARAVGVGLEPDGPAATVVWVHGVVPATGKLRARELREGEFDLDGFRAIDLTAEVAPGAAMLATHAPYARSSKGWLWSLWREGTTLVGACSLAPETARVDLGPDLVHVIEPALALADGSVQVLALLAGAPGAPCRLVHVAFDPPVRLRPRGARVVAEHPLRGPVSLARAGVGPARADAPRAEVLLAADGTDGVLLQRAALGGGAPTWRTATHAGASLAAGTSGDLRVEASGSRSLLLVRHEGALGLALCAWGDGEPIDDVLPAGPLPPDVLDGAARLPLLPGKRGEAWALVTRAGLVHASVHRDGQAPPGVLAAPLELLPLARLWAVGLDGDAVARMHELRRP